MVPGLSSPSLRFPAKHRRERLGWRRLSNSMQIWSYGSGSNRRITGFADQRLSSLATVANSSNLELRAGIEPANKGFADLRLTTWLPQRLHLPRTIFKISRGETFSAIVSDIRETMRLGMS